MSMSSAQTLRELKMTTRTRNVVELQEVEGEDLAEVIKSMNKTIVELNFILRSLTLGNLDGDAKTITIPAGATIKVNHKLRVIPKHRIITKQVGGGTITDGIYNRNWIELKNTGGSEAVLTVVIVKD